jgi:uncharacterized protein (TIGR02270 family)
MPATSSQPIPVVVQQHAEEAAHLRHVRSVLVAAPHVKLHHLRRLDDRIAAHLDGLAVAGEYGSKLCMAALETPGVGEVFAATVRAIEEKDAPWLDRLFALAEAVPESQRGLISAFGWVSSHDLQGTVRQLLSASVPLRRCVGLAACAMHRVDPGGPVEEALKSPDPALRARALRTLGELGRNDALAAVRSALDDADEECRFQAAWSAVILGDRGPALDMLMSVSRTAGPHRARALRLVLQALDLPRAHELLKLLARDARDIRVLIQGAGIAGDAQYVPWLIRQMDDLKLARLAGESFSFITGLDLAYLDLERRPPEGVEFGPTENPEDEDVAMDPDDSLPWPDPAKISAWWSANGSRFTSGVRWFMGETVNVENCQRVLREGYQRQRMAAALYLSLLQPGTILFPIRAPAWRQQRWLAPAASTS